MLWTVESSGTELKLKNIKRLNNSSSPPTVQCSGAVHNIMYNVCGGFSRVHSMPIKMITVEWLPNQYMVKNKPISSHHINQFKSLLFYYHSNPKYKFSSFQVIWLKNGFSFPLASSLPPSSPSFLLKSFSFVSLSVSNKNQHNRFQRKKERSCLCFKLNAGKGTVVVHSSKPKINNQ